MTLPSSVLFIVGMHRSGTSFLGECCGALGWTIPRDAGGPAADNPRGHFEPQAVVALNDALLAETGAIWQRIAPPTLPAPDPAVLSRLDAAIATSFGDADRIVVKDPRLSLTLPLWRAWADARGAKAVVVIALRDPREVAHSLDRRDGMAADAAMLSWIAHTLGSVEHSEGLPRQIVVFPDWMQAPSRTLEAIAALDGSSVPPDARRLADAAFIPGAVHGRGSTAAAEGPIEALAMELFTTLRTAANAGRVPPVADLAGFRKRLDALSAAARGVEAVHATRHRDDHDRIAALDARRVQLETDVADRLADCRAMADRITATEAQRDTAAAEFARRLTETERQRDEGLAAAQRRAAEAEAQRDAGMESAQRRIADTEAQRDEAVATFSRRLAATEAQRDEAAAAAQRHGAHADALQALLAATETQRDEMADLADDRWQVICALQDELAHATAHIEASDRALAEATRWLEKERMTVLKPIYRRLYRMGGRTLRSVVPAPVVERIKRRLPVPGGIPRGLAFTPLAADAAPAHGYAEVPARTGDKPDIFVMSIIGWDFRTQRPQHLATQMAAAGHRVFYLEMEQNLGEGTARDVAPGVQVIRLPNRGMRGLAAYTGVPTPRQAQAWVDHFHALTDAVGASPVSHVVIEHPYWWHLARHLSPEYQVTFDCMDDIGGFSNTEAHVLETEMDMIARADKMVVSSQYLYDKFAPMRDVVMVRNGTDVSHFIRDPDDEPAPGWLAGKLKPGTIRVGYVGAIAEWFDTDLLERVARDNPDFDIHLCGAVTAEPPLRLGKLANVTLHGEIPYRDVPTFHKQMDVLIIPFQLLPIIKACDPVKFYEYSAVMRPTVSTSLPELDRAGDLVFRADDPAAFAAQIRRAAPLARDAAFGQQLRRYALDNAWSYRAADMLAEMEREPRLSVVVLHYGADTDMTLATLHAMLGRGEVYPNLEVVLVDNGSTPAVLEVLRARAAADPRIVLVENGENLGFARGNNRGIAAASGDYVLLLNNDTFLAPGALLAMVRHLQRNPEIGIVGPMTNNIGNEARIEIAYADMDGMARAARALATGHRGQWSPIPVCAYFCAMFRRADLDRLGDLPEIYGRGMFEDDDHCATFRAAGLQTALAEDAFCHHHLSASFDALPSGEKQALFDRNKALYEDRWGAWVPHRYRETRPEPTLRRG
ncbi:glycosyltransferase [Paracoccus sphaerophysae]|uniref:glycosyltransferase n=1 Tax=Paracoccus sphaerophysae TaxID=690417 RepID=UPI0023565473|nr:glycosyltransferase [Paracoccus sphaerophysae]